ITDHWLLITAALNQLHGHSPLGQLRAILYNHYRDAVRISICAEKLARSRRRLAAGRRANSQIAAGAQSPRPSLYFKIGTRRRRSRYDSARRLGCRSHTLCAKEYELAGATALASIDSTAPAESLGCG